MATITSEGPSPAADEDAPYQVTDPRLLARLSALEREVADGNRAARRTGTGFTIFAGFALVIALVNLVVIAAKLNDSTTVVGPMMGSGAIATAPAAPAPARHIDVALKEFSIGLSHTVGRAGTVTFAVRNTGTMPHEFVVIHTAKPAAALLNGSRADETGNVGETGDLQPGQAKTISLTLKPGHYALICNLPGHYKAGQHTDFTVR